MMVTLLGLMTGEEITMTRRLVLNEQTLEDFIESDAEKLKIEMCSIQFVKDLVKSKDPEFKFEMDGDETNGWQVDFWYKFNCQGTKFTLSGSLHYGDFALTKGCDDD